MKVFNNLGRLTLLYFVITANIIGTLIGQYYYSDFNSEVLTGVVIGIPLWLVFIYLPFTLIFLGIRCLLKLNSNKIDGVKLGNIIKYLYDNAPYIILLYFILGLFNISFPFDSLMRISSILFDL